MITVGEKIKQFRQEKGMTQEELGKELGVGKAAIQKYESGQVQNLKSAHIKKLCQIFSKVPWVFIFDGEPDEHSLVIQQISNEDVLTAIAKLNQKGLAKILEYANDLAKIDEYIE